MLQDCRGYVGAIANAVEEILRDPAGVREIAVGRGRVVGEQHAIICNAVDDDLHTEITSGTQHVVYVSEIKGVLDPGARVVSIPIIACNRVGGDRGHA